MHYPSIYPIYDYLSTAMEVKQREDELNKLKIQNAYIKSRENTFCEIIDLLREHEEYIAVSLIYEYKNKIKECGEDIKLEETIKIKMIE